VVLGVHNADRHAHSNGIALDRLPATGDKIIDWPAFGSAFLFWARCSRHCGLITRTAARNVRRVEEMTLGGNFRVAVLFLCPMGQKTLYLANAIPLISFFAV
jgi:hypothetical protein